MSKEYDDKIKFESEFFDEEMYDPNLLIEKTTDALAYVLNSFDETIKVDLGLGPWDYIASQINSIPDAKILSIGSGPCGLELHIAKQLTGRYEFDCLDVNEKLLRMGKSKAQEENVRLELIVQDANKLSLQKAYDVIIAHASLHHFIELEHVFSELHNHLSNRGLLFVYEATPRNGMLLWPETKVIINEIFKILPDKFRMDHASQKEPVLRTEFPERDVSVDGFECVRSQDIIPLLESNFNIIKKYHAFAFARRFVDSEFGRNYDLRRVLDKTVLDMILTLDKTLLSNGFLKPEIAFYIAKRRA